MRISPVVLGLAFLLACPCQDATSMAKKLDADFIAQVPPGASKEKVVEFLRSHGIKAYAANSGRVLNASLPDIEKGVLVNSGVYMTFWFDASDHLSRHEIKAIASGP